MPKPFKPTRPFPLPAGAEVVEYDGRLCYRTKDKGRTVYYPLSKDGTKYLKPSKCWYFDIRDENGIIRRVKGSTDKAVTEQMIADWLRRIERRKLGYADPAEEHATRPLADHLKDYAVHLGAKGDTSAHVALTVSRIRAVLDGCGFVFLRDLDAGKVSAWLTTRRRGGTPVALPDKADFTPGEVADLLGITGAALRAAVKRLNLPATGNGKTRRFPRATVEALALNRAKGVSPETVNHYIRALRGFGRWLVRTKRIGSNPLETLTLQNTAADTRRCRRELTVDQLRRLLEATRTSDRTFRGLTGLDRYHLYLTAVSTGLRAGALANLTPENFDLNSPSPVVTVPARFSKNRRTHTVPLPADVAAELGPYFASKRAGSPIWGGTWVSSHRAAEMLRIDLEAAGIPYVVEGPDGPEYADFHALRHTYLTMLGRYGVDLRTLQELAGHSKPEITARYSHRRLYDLVGAVEKLPPLVPLLTPNTNVAAILRTGTDDAPAAALPLRGGAQKDAASGHSDAVPDAVTYCIGRHQSVSIGMSASVTAPFKASSQVLEMKQPGAYLHQVASLGVSEGDGTRTRNHRIDSPVL